MSEREKRERHLGEFNVCAKIEKNSNIKKYSQLTVP